MKLADWQRECRQIIKSQVATASHLEFYRAAYWQRMHSVLSADFPVLLRFLGTKKFLEEVNEFLRQSRAFQADLGEVSGSFAAFILKKFPETQESRAALLENTERECALLTSDPLPLAAKEGLLSLSASARLLRFDSRFYVVWRDKEGVERIRIAERDFQLLSCFAAAVSQSEALERMVEFAFTPEFVETQVAHWVATGLLLIS